MLINEILTNQEQINLVRLIMNTTLNALGQPVQPSQSTKSPVVQAVKGNRKSAAKTPKIPSPPAPKPFPKPRPIAGPMTIAKSMPAKPITPIRPRSPVSASDPKQAETSMPKRLQPLPTSVYSPINKNPSKRDKQELQDKNDLIDILKTAQKDR